MILIKIIAKEFSLEVIKEHKFHPTRRWRFDYCIPSKMIALEMEGGIWSKDGGRHNRGAGFIADMEKYNTATSMGWRLIRFVPGDYTSVLKYIKLILKNDNSTTKSSVR